MSVVAIGDRRVGDGEPCFVLAEAGVNHNGDPKLAHDLIDLAASAGADAVKFQTFDPDKLVTAEASTAPYQSEHTEAATQSELLEALVLPEDAWAPLRDHARDLGLIFLSTPFDVDSARMLVELGVPAIKVGSGELTNLPFLAELATLGPPLIVSTGLGTMDEVAAAVDAVQGAELLLLHCVTSYPAPTDSSNLRAIPAMRERFGVPVGWSDHTQGTLTSVAALALGATMIEKHITLDRSLPGPDHEASEDPESFQRFMRAVRETEAALGDGVKRPSEAEAVNIPHSRRSLYATRDLQAGETLDPESAVARRPAVGVSPAILLDSPRLRRDVAAGSVIVEDDVEAG